MRNLKLVQVFCTTISGSVFLCACEGNQDSYRHGYNDGYAAANGKTCEIRITPISKYWSSEEYSRGYSEGLAVGSRHCERDRMEESI